MMQCKLLKMSLNKLHNYKIQMK